MGLPESALATEPRSGRHSIRNNRRKGRALIAAVLSICVVVFTRQVYTMRAQVSLDSQLIKAIKRNDLRSVSHLIGMGASPNSIDTGLDKVSFTETVMRNIRAITKRDQETDQTPSALMVALNAWWKPEGGTDRPAQNTEIVELLINHRADVNHICADGATPTMEASISGRVEIVQLLIDKGAEINVRDEYGYSALDYADGRHQHAYTPSIIKILKRAGAKE